MASGINSIQAVQSCKCFRELGQEKSALRIGFATYDQTIHFYNLKNHMGQPEMLVVGDVNDVFVPLVEGFLVTLEEADVVLNRYDRYFKL